MCNICTVITWLLEALVTFITWCLSCIVIIALCVGFTVAVGAGVSYGYNYSIAEFMHTARGDVMWYMRYHPLNPNDPVFRPYEIKYLPATSSSPMLRNGTNNTSLKPRKHTFPFAAVPTTQENTESIEPFRRDNAEVYAEDDINVQRSRAGGDHPAIHLVQAPPVDYDDIFSIKKLQKSENSKPKKPSRVKTEEKRLADESYVMTTRTTVRLPASMLSILTSLPTTKIEPSPTSASTIQIKTTVPTSATINQATLSAATQRRTTGTAPGPITLTRSKFTAIFTTPQSVDLTQYGVYISDLYTPTGSSSTVKQVVKKQFKSVLQDIPDYTEDFV